VFGGGDAGQETSEGDDVGTDFSPVVAQDGNAKEDDVASHSIGEDVAVVEVNDDIEQAAGGSQKHSLGECADWNGGVIMRHWWMEGQSESIVKCELGAGFGVWDWFCIKFGAYRLNVSDLLSYFRILLRLLSV
jgi:hypothetical protein